MRHHAAALRTLRCRTQGMVFYPAICRDVFPLLYRGTERPRNTHGDGEVVRRVGVPVAPRARPVAQNLLLSRKSRATTRLQVCRRRICSAMHFLVFRGWSCKV